MELVDKLLEHGGLARQLLAGGSRLLGGGRVIMHNCGDLLNAIADLGDHLTDITVADNNVIDVVRVNETVSQDGTTRSVSLPKETSYIGFVLYSVNGKRVLENAPFEYHAGKKRAFVALVRLLSGAVAVGLREIVMKVLAVVGEYGDLVDIEINPILTLTVGVLAGVMCATRTVRVNRRRMVD